MANIFDGSDLKSVKDLQNAVLELKNDLISLKSSVEGLQSSFNKQSKSQSDVTDKTKKLTAVEKELENIQKRSEKITKETVKANQELLAKKRQLTEQVKKENKELRTGNGLFKSMTKSILAAGAAMFGIGVAINGLKKAFKNIADFEKAMSKVKAITGATDEEFKKLKQSAIDIASVTPKTSIEVANLQTELAKLGFTSTEILAATKAVVNLSIAAGSDLAESATVAAATIRGFGMSASEAKRVTDVMAKSFSSSALDLEKFSTAMAVVAPVAAKSGKDIEFTTAQLAQLANAGLDASTAGTSLRNIFLELSKRGMTWEEGLAAINNSTNKNTEALKLFGKRGATAALILADNIDASEDLEIALDNSAGAAEEMARIMADNLAGDIDKAKSAWDGFIQNLESGTGVVGKSGRALVQFGTKAIKSLNIFDLYFKKQKDLTEADYSRLLDNAEIIETEFGGSLQGVIDKFEFLTKTMTSQDWVDENSVKNAQQTFESLMTLNGESAESIEKFWEAYLKKRLVQVDIELKAIEDAERYKIKVAEESARMAELAAEEERQKAAEKRRKELEKSKNEFIKNAKSETRDLENELEDRYDNDLEFIKKQNELFQREFYNDVIQSEQDYTQIVEEETQKRLDAYKEQIEQQQELDKIYNEIKTEAENAAITIITDRYNNKIDEQLNSYLEANEAKKDALKNRLDKGLITEAEYEKRVKNLEYKAREESAKAEKKKALFSIGINTAASIIKTAANLGFPAAIPFIIALAALGAIQAAAVAAKPIPKFKHGTKGELKNDTYAIVGDGYKHETIIDPYGNYMLTPNTPTGVFLQKGSRVLSGEETEKLASKSNEYAELIKETKLTRKAITSQKNIRSEFTPNAVYYTIEEKNRIERIRKRYI